MKRELTTMVLTLVCGGLVYAIMGFAYMHSNFASKDILQTIDSRLQRIENALDNMKGR